MPTRSGNTQRQIHAIAYAIRHKVHEPGLAHGFEGIGHQHQIETNVAAFLLNLREHTGAVWPPALVHDLKPAPAAEIIAAQCRPMILDGAAALAMAAGNAGLLLNLRLVDGHGRAAHRAFAAGSSSQRLD